MTILREKKNNKKKKHTGSMVDFVFKIHFHKRHFMWQFLNLHKTGTCENERQNPEQTEHNCPQIIDEICSGIEKQTMEGKN